MWEIIDKGDYKLYVHQKIDLQLKIFDRQTYCEVHINYKGHNITFSMGIWDFRYACEEWKIKEKMSGNPKHEEEMYFTVEKNTEKAFADLIYFFLNERNKGDAMMRETNKIQNW